MPNFQFNPHFFEPPDNSNKKSFPLSYVEHCNFTTKFLHNMCMYPTF